MEIEFEFFKDMEVVFCVVDEFNLAKRKVLESLKNGRL